jgi:hypothetical protein
MAYQDRTALARQRAFVDKVQLAMMKAAITVLGQTTPDAKQLALAQLIIKEPERNAQTFSFGVVTDDAIAADSTDAALQTSVNALLAKYAK